MMNKRKKYTPEEKANMDAIVSRAMADFNKDQKQDIVHKTPTPKHSLLKTAGALATAATIGLGMTGCAEVQETPTTITAVQQNETKPSVIVTPTETTVKVTPTPTEAPTPTPTPEVLNNEELLNKAMDIEGLVKEVQGENVIYKENGEIVAMYNPNISINGEKVGGYALPENDVSELMTKKLAEIPDGEPKLEVTIPVDITKITSEDKLNIYDSVCTSVNNISVISVSSEKPMSLINVTSDDGEFFTGSGELSFLENGKTVKIKTFDIYPLACTNEYSRETATDSLLYFVDDKANHPAKKTFKMGEEIEVESTFIKICSNYNDPTSINTKNLFTTDTGEVVTIYPIKTETTN